MNRVTVPIPRVLDSESRAWLYRRRDEFLLPLGSWSPKEKKRGAPPNMPKLFFPDSCISLIHFSLPIGVSKELYRGQGIDWLDSLNKDASLTAMKNHSPLLLKSHRKSYTCTVTESLSTWLEFSDWWKRGARGLFLGRCWYGIISIR